MGIGGLDLGLTLKSNIGFCMFNISLFFHYFISLEEIGKNEPSWHDSEEHYLLDTPSTTPKLHSSFYIMNYNMIKNKKDYFCINNR